MGSLPLALPLLIPVAVLALPFVDLLLAVVRRVARGRSPFAPDKQHLHHRLLELGHSHRRAVLLLYFWSALLAFAGVGLSYDRGEWFVIGTLCSLAAVGILVSVAARDAHPGPHPAIRGGMTARPGAAPRPTRFRWAPESQVVCSHRLLAHVDSTSARAVAGPYSVPAAKIVAAMTHWLKT